MSVSNYETIYRGLESAVKATGSLASYGAYCLFSQKEKSDDLWQNVRYHLQRGHGAWHALAPGKNKILSFSVNWMQDHIKPKEIQKIQEQAKQILEASPEAVPSYMKYVPIQDCSWVDEGMCIGVTQLFLKAVLETRQVVSLDTVLLAAAKRFEEKVPQEAAVFKCIYRSYDIDNQKFAETFLLEKQGDDFRNLLYGITASPNILDRLLSSKQNISLYHATFNPDPKIFTNCADGIYRLMLINTRMEESSNGLVNYDVFSDGHAIVYIQEGQDRFVFDPCIGLIQLQEPTLDFFQRKLPETNTIILKQII